jgi:hypothetical protein
MNKITTLLSTLVLVLLLSFTAKAALPILDLPQTFSSSNYSGAIDLNDDGIADFNVLFSYYSYTGSGSGSGFFEYNCQIQGAVSGNRVLAGSLSPASPVSSNPPLTTPSYTYVNILPQGTPIEATPPVGSYWTYSDRIAWNNDFTAPAPTAPFFDTPDGYIGVEFYIGGQLHYGWIQVSVNNAAPSVTLGEPHAYASAPGSPILAGAGGVVPVPIIASVFGFLAIGAGLYFRRKRKK